MRKLLRYPPCKDELLQAWDAADDLLLEHVHKLELKDKRVLILNDQFGALTQGFLNRDDLDAENLAVYTDSYVSQQAIRQNTRADLPVLTRLEELEGHYDLALLRIPKTLSYLEDLLAHLSGHLAPGAQLIAGYMIKYQTPSSFDLIEKYIGKTRTTLAQKKARLILANLEREPAHSPYPSQIRIEGFDRPLLHGSNLFSREKLDVGTRFLLEYLPAGVEGKLLDLGCAGGIVGIQAKTLNPDARIVFSDDSRQAVESARANYSAYFDDEPELVWKNCFEDQSAGTLDFVLCNPPFHQGTTLGEHIAWQMFKDSHNALKEGGTLRIVGNSHLMHQHKLDKIFGNHQVIAKNSKFTICEAIR